MTDRPTPPSDPRAAAIASWLGRVRARARLLLVVERSGWIIAGAIGALIAGGVLDYVLRTPSSLRIIGLIATIAAIAWLIRQRVRPALGFQPSLTEIALRVEAARGDRAGAGVLASGLELGEQPTADAALAEPVVAQAAELTRTMNAGEVFRPRGAMASAGVAMAGVAALALMLAVQPMLTATGVRRMLTPWSSAEWPKRTRIVDATGLTHHPLRAALAIRAALVKSDRSAESTSVAAVYRIKGSSGWGPERRVLLKDQPSKVDAGVVDGAAASGTLFERLIEPSGLMPSAAASGSRDAGAASAAPTTMELEYRLETSDDRTEPVTMTLVQPPSVVRATLTSRPPTYVMGDANEQAASHPAATAELGPGTDERATVDGVLIGTLMQVRIELNKAVPGPDSATGASAPTEAWIERSLGPDAAAMLRDELSRASFSTADDGATWTISWTARGPVRLSVKPVDEFGIASGEESSYRFGTVTDNPPTASVTTPGEDRSVLPTAVVSLIGEGRDDVGLLRVAIERQLTRPVAGSDAARAIGAAEPVGERVEIAATDAKMERGAGTKQLIAASNLDLSTIELKPGDELWITATAVDAFDLDGVKYEPVRSTVRKLRIMSREQLVEQLWGELSSVRKSAIRMDQDQLEAQGLAAQTGTEPAQRGERAQAGLSERINRQGESLKRLQQRAEENGLADATMNQVLRDAQAALERAGKRSSEAAKQLGEAAKAQQAESAQAGKTERDAAMSEQQGVRDELSNLIDMLDQGEDTFASKRSLERLLEQQKSLRDRTEQTGRQTAGKPVESLSPEEKAALDRLGDEQQAAAEQLREAVDKMLEREQKLRKNDPAAAQAMAQAAEQTNRDQTAEKMQQASEQAKQNQTSNARQQQQQAIDSLEKAIKRLDEAQNAKDEVLKRFLASLIESIQGLIKQQEGELAELGKREATADFTGLDTGMATLHRNTLSVIDEASSGPKEGAAASQALEDAAEAQASSVGSLRTTPVVEDVVKGHEERSLEFLRQALAKAKEQQRQTKAREAQKKRGELKEKYQQAFDKQVSIRDNVEGLSKQELNRRTRAAARLAGQEQAELLAELEKLRQETTEIAEAGVLDFAHTRLHELMTGASARLGEGEADARVLRQQASAARVLKSLIESLDERKKPDQPFREGEQNQPGGGGGGGQQQQKLVPPAAEVVLLKLMQQEAAELTRAAADGAGDREALLAEAARLQTQLNTQGLALIQRLSKDAEEADQSKPEPKPEAPVEEPEGGT